MKGRDKKGFSDKTFRQLTRKSLSTFDLERPESKYPFYWLAPVVDRGVRLVNLYHAAGRPIEHAHGSNLFHFPKKSKFFQAILSFMGRGPREEKEPVIRLAGINGRYIVEQGRYWVRLATFLGLRCVRARVLDYDYASVVRRMRVFKLPGGAIVGMAGGKKGNCNYQGLGLVQMEVLVRQYQVPFVDLTSVRDAVGMTQGSPAARVGGTKRRSNLVLLKR